MAQESHRALDAAVFECEGMHQAESSKKVTVIVTLFDDGKHEVSCPKLGVNDNKRGTCQNGVTGLTEKCAYLTPQLLQEVRTSGNQ